MTPTQRSLEVARERGWAVEIVERTLTRRIKKDLWGADLIALDDYKGSHLIQTTTGANHAARRQKVLGIPEVRMWLERGNRFSVWSWSKRGPRGRRKVWVLREEPITLAMVAG